MYVGALRIELRIRDMRSLKEKRHVVKSIVTDIGKAHTVACAEVGYQDLWQRSDIGVSVVSSSVGRVERMMAGIQRDVEHRTDVEVLGAVRSIYAEEGR